jgi:hypothetical protein
METDMVQHFAAKFWNMKFNKTLSIHHQAVSCVHTDRQGNVNRCSTRLQICLKTEHFTILLKYSDPTQTLSTEWCCPVTLLNSQVFESYFGTQLER